VPISFDDRVGAVCARWVEWVDRRPGRVVAAALLLTVLLGTHAALTLGVNSDPKAMISSDLPFRMRQQEFDRSFRAATDEFLLLVDGESASVAARAAESLAEHLGERRDLFSRALVVGGGEFFERHALLYVEPEELEDFTDRLAAVQPFLGEFSRDPSVVGLGRLLSLALEARRDGHDVGLDFSSALDRLSAATEAALAGRAAPDPWGDELIGSTFSADARHRVVALQPELDFSDPIASEAAMQAVRAAIRDLELDAEHGVRVRVTGATPLNYDEQKVVQRQARWLAVASFVLFSLAMLAGLRSPRTILALVGALVTAVVWTNGFAALAVGHLNQVSAAFNVLVIGLGGELGIHFCMRYAELLSKGRSRAEALTETAYSVGSSLVSSAGTTSIGFLVFLPTDYRGVAELGLISAAGVLLSLLATFTILPALLSLEAPERPHVPAARLPALARLQHLPLRFARPIRWTALAVGIGAALLVPRARFDYNPIKLRDPGTESVQAMNDLLERSGTSPWFVNLVVPELPAAQALAARVGQLEPVERTLTLADFVPADQDEKLALLEDAYLFLPPPAQPAPPPDAATQLAALARLEAALAPEAVGPDDPKLAASAERLRAALARFREGPGAAADPSPALALLASNAVGSLPEQIAKLPAALSPQPVGLDDLPDEFRDQMLAADGRARVQVLARRDLSEGTALAEFVDAIRSVDPELSGPAAETLDFGRVTSSAMRQALLTSLIGMALFLFLLWRSVWDTLLAFFPLALAALTMCGVMVLTGMSFNFANVIVLPMLLGMGIDNGVHLVHRHRTNPEEADVLATSTARAVLDAALTTVLCFGSLSLASHRGMASLGQTLTLGVAATLICYVVVLPAVLEWDDRRPRRRRERAASRAPLDEPV
jgi:hypothetical protein